MATYVKILDNPALRKDFFGNWTAPTGKKVDELHAEVGIDSIPTQATAHSSCALTAVDGERVYVFNIGNAAPAEYFVAIPRRNVRMLTIKTADV